jgi:hypothetical protein
MISKEQQLPNFQKKTLLTDAKDDDIRVLRGGHGSAHLRL